MYFNQVKVWLAHIMTEFEKKLYTKEYFLQACDGFQGFL